MSEYRPLVLMVEDNADVLRLNGKWLDNAGFGTVSAGTLSEARKILEIQSPDIVILDILLPDGNGIEFLPEYRTLCDAPVLFCSSRNEDKDVLRGLEAGGDDYIPKPYNVEILVARVRAMWRTEQTNREKTRLALAAKTPERIIERGPLKLDILAGRAYMNGGDAGLKPKEFALLFTLIQNEGRIVPAKELYETVWNLPAADDTRTVRTHIYHLRAKLSIGEHTAVTIESEYGAGYIFAYSEIEK
jgi:DNA-binding response OmpR family regulator